MASILWTVLYVCWIASEVMIALRTRTRNSSGNVRDRGTMLLLWMVLIVCISTGIWFGAVNGTNLPGWGDWLRLAAIAALALGLTIRWSAVWTLGKSFSANVAIHATQTVMKSGLYRWMRHPSYTGLLLCILAVGLHTSNWIALLIVVVPPTMALLYRIHVEETALREHFGQEYIEYSRATSRLIPGVY